MKVLNKFFKYLYAKFLITYTILSIRIGIVLSNVEQQVFKINNFWVGRGNLESRKYSKHEFLENFLKGQRDEKYVKDYYEILKKADHFLQNATEDQMKVSADKYARSFGKADKYGNTHEFFGYFDPKHKYAGKTFKEVEKEILESKKLIKDNYNVLHIVKNSVIDNVDKYLDIENKEISRNDMFKRKMDLNFTLIINRKNNDVLNKIERLTDIMTIKYQGLDICKIEFQIPSKFKTYELAEDGSDIFKELIDIDEVYFRDTYGELIGYRIDNYSHRTEIRENEKIIYEVFTFIGGKIERSLI